MNGIYECEGLLKLLNVWILPFLLFCIEPQSAIPVIPFIGQGQSITENLHRQCQSLELCSNSNC